MHSFFLSNSQTRFGPNYIYIFIQPIGTWVFYNIFFTIFKQFPNLIFLIILISFSNLCFSISSFIQFYVFNLIFSNCTFLTLYFQFHVFHICVFQLNFLQLSVFNFMFSLTSCFFSLRIFNFMFFL